MDLIGSECKAKDCKNRIVAKDTAYCVIHNVVKNGGGPAGEDPFDQLKERFLSGEISKKQMKKERKILDRSLFGRTGSRKEKKRAKKRWKMPPVSLVSQRRSSVH